MDLTNTYFALISNESDPIKTNILGIEQLVNPESNNIKRLNNINELDLIYALEPFPITTRKSIFLAGPTPRNDFIKSWRIQAIQYLQEIGYDGIVFIPELRDKKWVDDYAELQIEWEHRALNSCDTIIFWIPRDLSLDNYNKPKMAGLTTNIEFGMFNTSNKIVVGIPDKNLNATSNQYIKYICEKNQIPLFNNLYQLLSFVNDKLPDALRVECECCIPSFLWLNHEFHNWYNQLVLNGNKLLDLKINYSFVMPKAKKLFFWIVSVKIYIKSENRIKSNEFVISRTNMVSTILLYPGTSLDDTYVVLVKEFRSPCNNNESFIYELPGGSSIKEKSSSLTAIEEVKEELGIDIDINRLQLISDRQCLGTLSAHKLIAYKYILNEQEFNYLEQLEGSIHGLEEDSERTYLIIKSIRDIINNKLVDWTNIGIILSALP